MPKFRAGDSVCCPTGALPGVDPFTSLTVLAVHKDGTVEVHRAVEPGERTPFRTWTTLPSELVAV